MDKGYFFGIVCYLWLVGYFVIFFRIVLIIRWIYGPKLRGKFSLNNSKDLPKCTVKTTFRQFAQEHTIELYVIATIPGIGYIIWQPYQI